MSRKRGLRTTTYQEIKIRERYILPCGRSLLSPACEGHMQQVVMTLASPPPQITHLQDINWKGGLANGTESVSAFGKEFLEASGSIRGKNYQSILRKLSAGVWYGERIALVTSHLDVRQQSLNRTGQLRNARV